MVFHFNILIVFNKLIQLANNLFSTYQVTLCVDNGDTVMNKKDVSPGSHIVGFVCCGDAITGNTWMLELEIRL